MRLTPIGLNAREIEGFYEGFANRTLWPLYHDAVRPPEFRREWWQSYVETNERFADLDREGGLEGRDGVGARLPAAPRAGDAARAAARPAHRLLPAHPAAAAGALHAAAVAPADRRGHARRRPRRLPAPVAAQNFLQICRPPRRRHADAHGDPLRGPQGEGRRVPGLDRLRRVRRASPRCPRRAGRGRRSRGARLPAPDPARRRPARLHEGHRRAAAGVPRAARERRHARRRDGARAGRDAEPRARRRPTASCASASSAPSAASTASSGASGTPRSTTSTTTSRARSCARSTRLPM